MGKKKSEFKQTDRILNISTPVGDNKVFLSSFSGVERLSGLFHFDLELWSIEDPIDPDSIVGKKVGFDVLKPDGKLRYFHGHVSRFSAGIKRGELRFYRAEIVPWLWFLTRTHDCKIFQKTDQTALSIIEEVFGAYSFSDFSKSDVKAAELPKIDYCVQYRESAFDFVSRLMEQAGIFYFFKHEKTKHTLVMANQNSAFKDGTKSEVEFETHPSGRSPHVDRIENWEHRYEYRTGKWSQTDYNFDKNPAGEEATPSKHLMTTESTALKTEKISSYEHYDYPGLYEAVADGKKYTKSYLQANEAQYHVVYGTSRVPDFTPGTKFKITKHPTKSENNKVYVLTNTTHFGNEGAVYRLTRPDDDIDIYQNEFTCIPSSVTYRPPLVTPKPTVHGNQTAVVVGKKGEEIWTDKYGRVKVQFYWDRDNKRDEKGLCWIRCAQSLAGNNWGAVFLPRIGQEVVVTFLEGDPDRPLITGLVYNSEQMPPYKLPDNKTISVIKTHSSKKGTAKHFNELRFEDKKDSEHIYLHAQKDFVRVVENNDVLHVGKHKKDGYGVTITTEGKGNQTIKIQNDRTITVMEGNEKLQVQKGNRDVIVDKGNDKHHVKTGNRDVVVDKGNDKHHIKKGNRTVDIDTGNDNLTLKKGNRTVKINAGKSLTQAAKSIELKVGSSSIKIEPAKITIKSPQIMIQGNAKTVVKAPMTSIQGDAKVEVKAPMTFVTGAGMLKLKGGVVMIN